jgi:hypothetical protein
VVARQVGRPSSRRSSGRAGEGGVDVAGARVRVVAQDLQKDAAGGGDPDPAWTSSAMAAWRMSSVAVPEMSMPA